MVYNNIIIFWDYISESFVTVKNIKVYEDNLSKDTKTMA
mgnify:CR=1 FL=1